MSVRVLIVVVALVVGLGAWPAGLTIHPLLGIGLVLAGVVVATGMLLRRLVKLGIAVLLLTLGVPLVVATVGRSVVKPYRVPSESMLPTIDVGDRVLVNRHDTTPKVGDVVIFHPPVSAEEQGCGERPSRTSMCVRGTGGKAGDVVFIKRVVAGPGDRVALVGGRVVRNGRRVPEPYVRRCAPDSGCDFPTPITVPDGQWLMLGDNRGESDDSRYWGTVPTSWIVGTAFYRYWPSGRTGGL